MKQIFTAGELIRHIERSFNNPHALVTFEGDRWHSTSTEQMIKEIKLAAYGLLMLGVKKGDRVGIIALPCSRWTIADLAIMAIGAISVPLFANISEENFLFEIKQSELKVAFVSGPDQWRRCEEYSNLFTHLIGLEDKKPDYKLALSFSELLKKGEQRKKQFPEELNKLIDHLNPEDIATIIYTSGSTGVPKGAVHTHHSLCSLLHTEMFNWDWKNDKYLSFLPIAHVFARVLNFIMVTWGVSIYYFNDIKNISTACKEVRPSLMIVVPRLLEKMYAKMQQRIQTATGLKKWIGNWAFNLANQENPTAFQRLLYPIADHLVFKKLRDAIGDNFRVIISGGAALNPSLNRFFLNVGIPVYEGWGLTEACPVTVSRKGHQKIGSVGLAIPGMQVKVSPEKELLVKGEMVMKEYYLNPEATKLSFTSDGWLKTGDSGEKDKNGFVSIVGRQKELFKTSTGEVIAPNPIEQVICKIPYIDLAMVIADNRKFASALLVADHDALVAWKKKINLTHLDDEEFLNNPSVQSQVENDLMKVNEHLNSWEKIRRFRFIPHNLSIETGELTPSMKIRREVIEEKYKDLVDSMYKEELHE